MHAYVRLVERGSFTAVAQELRVRQSTVSKWIAALEEELGAQLVERTTRALRVTEPGELFYERAKAILGAYEDATAELVASEPAIRGRLRVSLPVVFGRLFVVPELPALLRRHPSLEVELVFSDRYVSLAREGIDVALRVGTPEPSSLRARTLGATGRRLVASPGYVKRRGSPRRPADLGEHECLLHSGLTTGDVWRFRRGQRSHRAKVEGRFAANHSDALRAMARAGLGVALLATWLVDADLRRGRLVELLPGYDAPTAPVQALMPPTRFVHPRVRAFVDHLAATLAPTLDAFG